MVEEAKKWKVWDLVRFLKRDYQLTFTSNSGQQVMKDLAKFCMGTDTCFNQDPYIQARNEGRREVWLRIAKFVGLSTEQLYSLISGQTLQFNNEDEDNG